MIEPPALEIVKKALERIGGSVIPLHCFASEGCLFWTGIQSLLDDAAYLNVTPCQSTQLFPLATVIRSLSFTHGSRVQGRKIVPSKENTCLTIEIGNKILEISLNEQHDKIRGRKMQSSPEDSWWQLQNLSCLHGYAVIKKNSHILNVPVQCRYLCVQHRQENSGKYTAAYTSGLFEKMLSQLAITKSILVLVSKMHGQVVLLEPQTKHTASLSLLGSSLSVEKMLQHIRTTRAYVTDDQNMSCDMIVQRAKSLHVTKDIDFEEMKDTSQFDAQQLSGWVIPGCSKTVHTLVTKLNERMSELDFLSPDEVETLKQLKKMYRAERQPPGLRDTATCNNSNTEAKPESQEKTECQQKGRTVQISLSRADKILSKSKEMVESSNQKKETSEDVVSKFDTGKPQVLSQFSDLKNEDELKRYLASTYERAVSGELTDTDSYVQSLISVALHYFQQNESGTCPKQSCKRLLEKTVLTSGSQLREKYSHDPELSKEKRIAEYEAQILVRMEMMSSLEDNKETEGEEALNEIVGMLRTLSFISEPGLLSKFMQSSLLHNYMHTIPQTLGFIYDELMQPWPDSLANILSPEDGSPYQSGLQDVSLGSDQGLGGPPSTRTRSHGLVEPHSQLNQTELSTSTCRGKRKLAHHYSMVDFGPKRQIVVNKMPKKEKVRSPKRKIRHSPRKRKATKSPYKKKRSGARLQRHQSVAVMQHSHKTPKKNEPGKYAVTPRRQKDKLVAETPRHKQVSRLSSMALTSTDVVTESPEKACDLTHVHSPAKGKRAKALLRRSFYSAGPTKRTKNLSQYFQLANRIGGRHSQPVTDTKKQAKLISFEAPDQFKSPDKNSSFLLSQLGASPSPAKVTPRKITKTPIKVLDSPCHNTRSKVCKSPSDGLQRYPVSGRKSPSSHYIQRSHCIQTLAAESRGSTGPLMSETTPKKSSAVSSVPFGLDSPSQNTRQKVAQTPTRRSVRAVLFSKSPEAKSHSPYRASASPRFLLDRFGSPVKTSDKHLSKHRGNCQFEKLGTRTSVCEKLDTTTCSVKDSIKDHSFSETADAVKVTDNANHFAGIKTPSPRTERISKTSESFSKWPRVKSHVSQTSPSLKTSETVVCTKQPFHAVTVNNDEYKVKQVRGSARKKRCLLQSPEKSVDSLKRMKTVDDDSIFSSQGFDVTATYNERSQLSRGSSLSYSPTMIDDVFLTEKSQDSVCDEKVVKAKKRLLVLDEQYSDQYKSAVDHSKQSCPGINKFETDVGQVSPVRVTKSPATKKYSPNVSAKSLMHLIQSPLLNSSESKKASQLLSRNSAGVSPKSKVGGFSRRSLKLNN